MFVGKHQSLRDGQHAEVKEVVKAGDQVGIGIQFLNDNFPMGAHPDECELVVEWQGA